MQELFTMAAVFKLLGVAFMLMVAGVAAETHHIAGGPGFNVTAWLLGRVFTVGDQIRLGSDDRMVEVRGVDEFVSCDVSNPIRMVGEAVALEEEGIRYFTSSDPESCRNGLKLPVAVHRHHDFDPEVPSPPYDPYKPDEPYPPYKPDEPYPPYEPDEPYPPRKPDVPDPPTPSAAARLNAFSFALSAAMSIYYLAI